jgi:hypothetical protein
MVERNGAKFERASVTYGYPPDTLFAKYFWFAISFIFLSLFPIWTMSQHAPGRNFFDFPLIAELGLVFCPFSALIILFNIFASYRPIKVDDSAITAVIGTHAFRRIPWSEVSYLEKSRWFDQIKSRYRVTYSIIGVRAKIKFQEELVELPRLLDNLNAQAIKNGIEIVSLDYGLDTRRAALASENDPRKRRDIRRGVRTKLLRF